MANVLASVADSETEVRAERIVAGQAVARERGVKFGRPKGTGKRIKVTPEQEEAIHRLKFGRQEDRRYRPRHRPVSSHDLLRDWWAVLIRASVGAGFSARLDLVPTDSPAGPMPRPPRRAGEVAKALAGTEVYADLSPIVAELRAGVLNGVGQRRGAASPGTTTRSNACWTAWPEGVRPPRAPTLLSLPPVLSDPLSPGCTGSSPSAMPPPGTPASDAGRPRRSR